MKQLHGWEITLTGIIYIIIVLMFLWESVDTKETTYDVMGWVHAVGCPGGQLGYSDNKIILLTKFLSMV